MMRTARKYRFGPFQLDSREHCLLRDGTELPLQPKAFEILCVLVEHAGRLVTKEELLRQVWPDAVVEENNLNKNISLLRKILGGCAKNGSCIETVPRVGYRFVGKLTICEPPLTLPCVQQHASLSPHPEKSVAVRYFDNLSGDKEDEYFRDGITEDVITELAKVKGFCVFPRSCVFAFRDTPIPVTQVGRQLGAAFVLEGSIRRAGECLRITARLLETSSGHSVWTERYDRHLQNAFAIQEEIAREIGRALREILTESGEQEIEKMPDTGSHA